MRALSLRMPVRFLRGDVSRLGLMIFALACGVALICAFDLVNRAVLAAFVEVVEAMSGRAAIQVTPGGNGFFPESVAETIGKVPGVAMAVPVVSATTFATAGTNELLTVHGVDITDDAAVRVYDVKNDDGMELDDPLVVLSRPDSIILTKAFTGRRGLRLGDRIELATPHGRHTFTIRGLLEPHGVARVFAGDLVVMDLYAAESAFVRPGFINRVDVVLDPAADLRTVASAVAAVVPSLRVDTPQQRRADIGRVVQSLQVLLTAMGLVGLAVAYLISFNRLSTAFEGRMWQIGILRAVGVPMRSVWIDLVKEGMLLGAGGVAIGVPLGIMIARFVLPIVATTTALSYKLIAPEVQLAIRVPSLILAAACGIGTGIVAAALPAARAARMTVLDVLRGRGVERGGGPTRALCLGIVAVVAVVVGAESRLHSPFLGIVATVLIALATAILARPFVRFMEGCLFPLLARLFGPAGRFAGAVLRQSRRRTALTVATLGLGLGAVCWLWIVGKSFENSVVEVLSSAFRSDLVVSSSHVESGAFEAPVSKHLLSELARVPGVRAVAGERVVDWHYAGAPLVIEAFDGSYLADSEFGRWPLLAQSISDPWEAVARGEGFVVSSTLVRRTSARVGERVTLETPAGPLSLPVVGVTMDFASPQGTLKMVRSLYERLWYDDTITLAFVEVDSPGRVEEVRLAVAASVGSKYQLRILSARELVAYYGEQVRRAFAAVDALAIMVLVVVLLGVADALAASVMERTRELGVIRAVGVARSTLRKSIMLEGLALAIMGIVLGVTAGGLLGVLWVEDTFPALLGWVLVLHVPYAVITAGAALTVLVCLAASALPARRAARLEAATALRYE